MVDITHFSHVAALPKSALDTRVTLDANQTQVINAPIPTGGGHTFGFASKPPPLTAGQALENAQVRAEFLVALTQKYGANAIPDAVVRELTPQGRATATLMASDVHRILTEVHTNADTQVQLTVPPHGHAVSVNLNTLPMALVQSTATANGVQAVLQQKVNDGHQIIDDLRNGVVPNPNPPQAKDVADCLWFLYTLGEHINGQAIPEGALNIHDPGNSIRNYFDSCQSEVYQRSSSHVDEKGGFQSMQGGIHRGIDLDSGLGWNTQLPHGFAHVMYGRLGTDVTHPGIAMPHERLFIKIESHGCRYNTLMSWSRDPQGPADRPARPGDKTNSLGHGLSFMNTRGVVAAQDARKERIRDDIKTSYSDLTKLATGADQTVLKQDNPTGLSSGIRVMERNLITLRNNLGSPLNLPDNKLALHTAATNLLMTIQGDYPDAASRAVRIGNEVILMNTDF